MRIPCWGTTSFFIACTRQDHYVMKMLSLNTCFFCSTIFCMGIEQLSAKFMHVLLCESVTLGSFEAAGEKEGRTGYCNNVNGLPYVCLEMFCHACDICQACSHRMEYFFCALMVHIFFSLLLWQFDACSLWFCIHAVLASFFVQASYVKGMLCLSSFLLPQVQELVQAAICLESSLSRVFAALPM